MTDNLEAIYDIKSAVILQAIGGLKTKFADIPAVAAYADSLEQLELRARANWKDMLAQLRAERANGGIVCEFEWSDGTARETGLLVLKSGAIVKRIQLSRWPAPKQPPSRGNRSLNPTRQP